MSEIVTASAKPIVDESPLQAVTKTPQDELARAAGVKPAVKDKGYEATGEKDIGEKVMEITKEREMGR